MHSEEEARYYARSGSDRTDDWPFWFVADREQGGLNVTVRVFPAMRGCWPFLPRSVAEEVAKYANVATEPQRTKP